MYNQSIRYILKHLRVNKLELSSYLNSKVSCSYLASRNYLSTTVLPQINENKYNFVKKSGEKDVIAGGDSNSFGDLSNRFKVEKEMDEMPEEQDDIVRKTYLDNRQRKTRLSTKQYADIIKKLLAEKKLLEAVDVLEVQMIKQDRVQPENYIYNILIDGAAKLGYTKLAFKLYNDMKKRDLKVTGATYTSLFNGCALSPVQGDGLKRAQQLRELIIEKGVLLNRSNYHAMMKAFGRHGDIETVFSLVDEMVSKKIPLVPETFCFLLQACLSNKQDGFRHAIMVWRKMREKRVKPNIYCYNLMLRCARDTQIHHSSLLTQDLRLISSSQSQNEEVKLLEGKSISLENKNLSLPNLLSCKPDISSVVSIDSVDKPKNRLMLVGGMNGILNEMQVDGVEPDVKTATLLSDLIPSTSRSEFELISRLEQLKIELDIDFFNMLIRKRCMRKDYIGARQVLNLISKYKLKPNLVTFGVLSLSCRNTKDCKDLLKDLFEYGYRPNMEILGGLLCAARHSFNIEVITHIMDIVLSQQIKISRLFQNHLDKFMAFTEKQIQLKRDNLPYHKVIDNDLYLESYQKFLVKYKVWIKLVEVETRDNIHPWSQFKRNKKTAYD